MHDTASKSKPVILQKGLESCTLFTLSEQGCLDTAYHDFLYIINIWETYDITT